MSDVQDMLILARAMGKDIAFIELDNVHYCDQEGQDLSIFKPSTGELIEWLLSLGVFTFISKDAVDFRHIFLDKSISYDIRVQEDNLSKNIESVSIQVARYFNSEILCPGCSTQIDLDTAGGYRNYCIKCVKAMPDFPTDKRGYNIEGIYPNFKWVTND